VSAANDGGGADSDAGAGTVKRRMAKSSSLKKVSRAAASGGGRVSRPGERNVFFPLAMALVVIVGVILIVVARGERIENADNSPPRVNDDHFHSGFVINVCGVESSLPNGRPDNRSGLHTHGDGLVHIHPFVSTVSGRNATVGAFFEEDGLLISDTELRLPSGSLVEGVDTCDGEPGEVRVLKWVTTSAQDPLVFDTEVASVRFDQANATQGQLFVFAFVAENTPNSDIPRPDDEFLGQYVILPPSEQPLGVDDTGDPLPSSSVVEPTDAPVTSEAPADDGG